MPLARDVVTSALQFKHQIKKNQNLGLQFPFYSSCYQSTEENLKEYF